MRPSKTAYDLIAHFEGTGPVDKRTRNLLPYVCPAGYVTIGHGHVVLDSEGRMLHGQSGLAIAKAMYPEGITPEEARELLIADMEGFASELRRIVAPDTTQGQFDALVSFTYNFGITKLAGSSVLKLHNEGKRTSPHPAYDPELIRRAVGPMFRATNAADALLVWNKAKDAQGKVRLLQGLYVRRHAERAVYLGAPWKTQL